jgi:non-heme chloroperoxidase
LEASTVASSDFFTTSDGVRLHYLEKGSGPPLIMLPGWTQPASRFAAQLKALSNNFHCLALDFRGHGESERPDHGYRVSRLAKDCLDLLDHLGLQDAVLLGHSAGCTVIWSFIDLFGQDRVRALVFSDEMIALVKRPEWSEAECRKYGASLGGDEVLAMAAAIVGPDGEQVMHTLFPACLVLGFQRPTLRGSSKIA